MNNNQKNQESIFQFVSNTINEARNALTNSEDINYTRKFGNQSNNEKLPVELLIPVESTGDKLNIQVKEEVYSIISDNDLDQIVQLIKKYQPNTRQVIIIGTLMRN
ncbi:hypothetical protein Glove_209g62 [Diversispora epigaea]|uniref:Uncharacterized protein n=1 Tax=Diversispora epigaea TaxID=1348612 RepID=A0A397IIY4_9GLOM|nr:hypothetical protein Glove_209g62 [Diversispora epigaea]